jgi:NhaC family Na+:H+ antiporter
MNILNEMYDWNIVMLIPFIIILVCAFTKQPPVPTMVGASFAAIAIGAITQGFDLASGVAASVNGFTVDMIYDSEVTSEVAGLLNRGGMKSMVGIIIVIYCGYVYAAIISKAGFLETALRPVIKRANSRVSVVTAALATDFIILCCAGSSYVAHIMVGEMYKKSFIKNGMDLRVLSRSMEDVGTMMAPLIPWGASGAFYIATLGVPIFGEGGFAPWAFNTWLNPIIAIILAATGIGMYKLTKEQQDEELAKLEAEENIL